MATIFNMGKIPDYSNANSLTVVSGGGEGCNIPPNSFFLVLKIENVQQRGKINTGIFKIILSLLFSKTNGKLSKLGGQGCCCNPLTYFEDISDMQSKLCLQVRIVIF